MTRATIPLDDPADVRYLDELQEFVASCHPAFNGESAVRTILDSVGEGLSIVDEKQKFLFVNSAGEKCFGTALGGLNGRTLAEFVPQGGIDAVSEQVLRRRRGDTSTYDLEIVREDGEIRQLLVTASPRFSTNDDFRGAVAVFRDVTDRNQIEKDLRESHSRLERLVRMRTRDLQGSSDLLREEMLSYLRQIEDLATIGALTVGLLRDAHEPLKTIRTLAETIVEKSEVRDNRGILIAAQAILETTSFAEEIVMLGA